MQKLIMIALGLIFASLLNAQGLYGPYIPELKGMEDKGGNTHLFYRQYTYYRNGYYKDIWHYDLKSQKDTLFLHDFANPGRYEIEIENVNCIRFWDSDPTKYIYCGIAGWLAHFSYIWRFDGRFFYTNYVKSIDKLFISGRNDSILLAAASPWLISKDGGRSWDSVRSCKYGDTLIAAHPLNESTVFFLRNGQLFKSKDLDNSSQIVDTIKTSGTGDFVFDSDMKHIYRIYYANGFVFSVSDDEGEPGSWRQLYKSKNNLLFSLDAGKSGNVYLADGNSIYFSGDYGKTFSLYKTFGQILSGVYKKPNSNILYASTRNKIYQVTSDSVIIIKRLQIPNGVLNYYPLSIGNLWIYNTTPGDNIMNFEAGKKVIGDTLMDNGFRYYSIYEYNNGRKKSSSYSFERIDSATGQVYKYDIAALPKKEILIEDLTSENGDIVTLPKSINPLFTDYQCSSFTSTLWNKNLEGLKFDAFINGTRGYSYSLVKSIGLTEYKWNTDAGLTGSACIKGCIIDGITYGDTIFTAVEKDINNSTLKYELYKSYPNPFNPSTTIEYKLAKTSFVNISVYNSLGQIVAELVNKEQSMGMHETVFNAIGLASGIYFCRMNAGGKIFTIKLMLMK